MLSLNDFKTWAKNSGATVGGNLLVENDQLNPQRAEVFLSDLRDRFASNPKFSESIANTIEQVNKVHSVKIPAYTPKTAPGTPGNPAVNPGAAGETTPEGSANSGVAQKNDKTGQPGDKADQSGDNAGQSAITPQQSVALQQAVRTGALAILNGRTIDFDAVWEKASIIQKMFISDGPTYQELGIIVSRISNVVRDFRSLLGDKTPGRTSIGASPNEDSQTLALKIRNTFNNGIKPDAVPNAPGKPVPRGVYLYAELAQIAANYASLCSEISDLYSSLLSRPFLAQFTELEKQLDMAKAYQENFKYASDRLTSLNQAVPGNNLPV